MKKIMYVLPVIIIVASFLIQGFIPLSTPQQLSQHSVILQSRTIVPQQGIDKVLTDQLSTAEDHLHYIAQFKQILSDEERASFLAQDIQILDYLPEYAYIVSSPPDKVSVLAQTAFALIGIEPQDKFPPRISNGFRKSAVSPPGFVNLLVKFYDDVSLVDASSLLKENGVTILHEIPSLNTLTVNIPKKAVSSLLNFDEVQWIEEENRDLVEHLNLSRKAVDVEIVQAQPYGLTGVGVDIMQHDGGWANSSHPDLKGRVIIGDNNCGVGPHATFVAGILIGTGFLSNKDLRGMANSSVIDAYCPSNFDYNMTGDIDADYKNAIINKGVDLSSNSWGLVVNQTSECPLMGDYILLSNLYDQLTRGKYSQKKLPIVFSAGNERAYPNNCGTNPGQWENYGNIDPGGQSAKNTLVVGASYSVYGNVTFFTSFGPVDDGRLKPEVMAPGDEIDGPLGITSTQAFSTPPYYSYEEGYGTSASAPHVAGGIALLMEAYRKVHKTNRDFISSTAKALFVQTAKDIAKPGPDYQSGYGVINMTAAALIVLSDTIDKSRNLIIEDNVTDGRTRTYMLIVPQNKKELKVTLAWDDKETSPNAGKTLVNDLDLSFVSPSGTTVYPYVLNNNTPSDPATTGINRIDNLEQVKVTNPQAGNWTVLVKGTIVPVGPQSYSLVNTDLDFKRVICIFKSGTPSGGSGPCSIV